MLYRHSQAVIDFIIPPSPRDLYARNFGDEDPVYQQWATEFELAKADSLMGEFPFVFNGHVTMGQSALQYDFSLRTGRHYYIDFNLADSLLPVFINFYRIDEMELIQLEEDRYDGRPLELDVSQDGDYKLIVQAGLEELSQIQMIGYAEAKFQFPVAGKGNRAIQSLWGAPRDGGRRIHKGIDIFAKRGTPLIASTDGHVSYAGSKGLGGKQVWLRSSDVGMSIYYAHLDQISVDKGDAVNRGDTIGTVGNTGNAKTTPPHLHLGLYGARGAIDPLPFVEIQDSPDMKDVKAPLKGIIYPKSSNVRLGPNKSFPIKLNFNTESSVDILGRIDNWYQIKNEWGEVGFIYESLVEVIR